MSLRMHLGRRGSPLVERPNAAGMLRVELPSCWPRNGGTGSTCAASRPRSSTRSGTRPPRSRRFGRTCLPRRPAVHAVRAGRKLLVVSDRAGRPTLRRSRCSSRGRDPAGAGRAPGSAHARDLVAETGDAFDIHHFACSSGTAPRRCIPWLALATVESHLRRGRGTEEAADTPRPSPAEAVAAATAVPPRRACSRSSRRWASPRCRRTAARRSSRRSDSGDEVIDAAFSGTPSPIGGVGFSELAEDVMARHAAAYAAAARRLGTARLRPRPLPEGGRGPWLVAPGGRGPAAGGEGRHRQRRGV